MVFCDLILACILYARVLDHLRRFKGEQRVNEIPWLF